MSRRYLLPERFPMVIKQHKKLIVDPTMGSYDQFVITVNGLEVARSIDEELCTVMLRFLATNITKCFGKTAQGKKLLETLYLLSEKEKLKPEYDAKGNLIIREITDKKIIH